MLGTEMRIPLHNVFQRFMATSMQSVQLPFKLEEKSACVNCLFCTVLRGHRTVTRFKLKPELRKDHIASLKAQGRVAN